MFKYQEASKGRIGNRPMRYQKLIPRQWLWGSQKGCHLVYSKSIRFTTINHTLPVASAYPTRIAGLLVLLGKQWFGAGDPDWDVHKSMEPQHR